MSDYRKDRELLELAAKAAGFEICSFQHGKANCYGLDGKNNFHWDPLVDDGDALRLAVRFGFDIRPAANISTIHVWSEVLDKWVGEFYGSSCDPYAATRRAIVRAAAAIGKGMK